MSPPGAQAIDVALGGLHCTAIAPATAAACSESLTDIFGLAATAEALGTTFYYQAIGGGFFASLPQPRQWYLQAALDQERTHLNFLASRGALPAARVAEALKKYGIDPAKPAPWTV